MSAEATTDPRPPDGTEQQILEAAATIIATEDFDALSMRRVAAEAGVSLSTVVRHFGTKDALLAALVAYGGEDERNEERRAMEPGDVAAAVRIVAADYEDCGAAAPAHAGPGAPLPRPRRAARHRPPGPPRVGAVGVRPAARRRRGAGRTQVEDLLVVGTDVYTWKLLRLDRGLGARATRAAMVELCEAVAAR